MDHFVVHRHLVGPSNLFYVTSGRSNRRNLDSCSLVFVPLELQLSAPRESYSSRTTYPYQPSFVYLDPRTTSQITSDGTTMFQRNGWP